MAKTDPKQLVTSRTYKDRGVVIGESDDADTIEVRQAPEGVALAHISYGNKFTKNLTNFESVSIDVRLTLPSTLEELDEAYDAAKNVVESKLAKEYADLKKQFPAAFTQGLLR